ncbi:tRNA pseudouridine(38-40) synthase TruA [Clostridiales bacterium F-3ap]|uniref:tRNA pseudouridine synthase A n=2 Tax=Anaerotalea alkaliphila TaxID=2662126 RepID=A0A7X5HU55_9FIRM|nr:tRNA pseudouridine(38-40) synthase TruA [Anaerotalea alkaliphila]
MEHGARNIKMVVRYEGTRYAGWQRLPHGQEPTVQGKLEDVLSKMTGEDVKVIGSGRTDRGVHAWAQTANFHTRSGKSCGNIRAYLQQYLPEDLAVLSVEEVEADFHARFKAVDKTYRYRIHRAGHPPVFERNFVHHLPGALDLKAMEACVPVLLGTHDFQAFSNKKTKKSTVRTLHAVTFREEGEELWVDMRGDGFLYNMARILAGTLLDAGRGKLGPEEVRALLESGKRNGEIERVPAKGLFLMEVTYP